MSTIVNETFRLILRKDDEVEHNTHCKEYVNFDIKVGRRKPDSGRVNSGQGSFRTVVQFKISALQYANGSWDLTRIRLRGFGKTLSIPLGFRI